MVSNNSRQHNFCLSYRLCMLRGPGQDIKWTCKWAFCFLLGQHITRNFPWTKFLAQYSRVRYHHYDNVWSEVAQSDILRNKARSHLLNWPVPFENWYCMFTAYRTSLSSTGADCSLKMEEETSTEFSSCCQCVFLLSACVYYWFLYLLIQTKILWLYFRETAVELLNNWNTHSLPYKNKPLWSIMLHTNIGY